MDDRPGQYGMERAECPIQALFRADASRSFDSIVAQTQPLIFRRHRPFGRGLTRRVCAQDTILGHDDAPLEHPHRADEFAGLVRHDLDANRLSGRQVLLLLTSAKMTLPEPDANSFRQKLNRTNLPWRTTMVSNLYRQWRCWPCRGGKIVKHLEDLLLRRVALLAAVFDRFGDTVNRLPLMTQIAIVLGQRLAALLDQARERSDAMHPWTEGFRQQVAARAHGMEPFERCRGPGIGGHTHERADHGLVELLVHL